MHTKFSKNHSPEFFHTSQ